MAAENDPYDLARFVAAQDSSGTYRAALAEIRVGRKTGHWMWFVFPQIAGLGRSPVAQRYAISGLAEARAYLAHPVLGLRLRECAAALLDVEDRTALQIFGGIDEMKLRSSMTLFATATASEHRRRVGAEERSELSQDSAEQSDTATADPDEPVFRAVLDRYFGGRDDETTLRILGHPR
jgi:uncharacterized protein (DUF1810 family)